MPVRASWGGELWIVDCGLWIVDCGKVQCLVVPRCLLAAQNEAELGSASPLEQHIKVFARPQATGKRPMQAVACWKSPLVKNMERRSFLLAPTVSVHLGSFGKVAPPSGPAYKPLILFCPSSAQSFVLARVMINGLPACFDSHGTRPYLFRALCPSTTANQLREVLHVAITGWGTFRGRTGFCIRC
jgi:hypothetical protein